MYVTAFNEILSVVGMYDCVQTLLLVSACTFVRGLPLCFGKSAQDRSSPSRAVRTPFLEEAKVFPHEQPLAIGRPPAASVCRDYADSLSVSTAQREL